MKFDFTEVIHFQYKDGEITTINLSKLPASNEVFARFYNGTEINLECDELGLVKIPLEIALRIDSYDNMQHFKGYYSCSNTDVTVSYNLREYSGFKELNDLECIKKRASSLDGMKNYQKELNIAGKANPNYRFNTVLLFDRYYVDQIGNCWTLKNIISEGDNIVLDEKTRENTLMTEGWAIPEESAVCPICGKKITFDDFKKGKCEENKEFGFCHVGCLNGFLNLRTKEELVGLVYSEYNPYDLVNYDRRREAYRFQEVQETALADLNFRIRNPWFIFHVNDGDITIGWNSASYRIIFENIDFPQSIFEKENLELYHIYYGSIQQGKIVAASNLEDAGKALRLVYDYLHKKGNEPCRLRPDEICPPYSY